MARWLICSTLVVCAAACNLAQPAAVRNSGAVPAAAEPITDTASNPTESRSGGDVPGSNDSKATDAPVAPGEAGLYLTTMTHMEGGWNDDRVEGVFLEHVDQLRYGMDLAEEYGALLTIESEQPFARANVLWDLNIMAEIRDRGFGVGTHCDFGFRTPVLPVEDYAAYFEENKRLVDRLVGAENNRGCSGGGSANDWALAASLAGFDYLDGMVTMHYLSMPMENRPGSEWTDAFIQSGNHHFNAPLDFWQRIYPFGVADARDLIPDANPVIVVNSGELGVLSAIAEQGNEYRSGASRGGNFPLNQADVDRLAEIIREADRGRDRTRVAKLTVYLPSNYFVPENEAVLRYFFSQMQGLADQGLIEWATQLQVYQAYIARQS